MNQPQLNEAYKAKHMITKIPSTPPVASKSFLAAHLAAQHQSEQEQWDANNGSNFVTQEDSHQPQRQTFNKNPVNAPIFET